MRAASCFSGIGAPEMAGPQYDWIWHAEIEPFPSAVMAERFPDSINMGDVLAPDFIDRAKALGPLDLMAGGPPCQAFSIAGLRNSMSDPRGNLTLRWVQILHAIRPRNAITENVPGWLNTPDNAFGCFLAGLVGADDPLRCPTGDGWPGQGMVAGPRARAAWRILDAQYFGVAQRRRRVFVVADFGEGADPATVLFERQGVHGNPAPRREKGEGTAGTLSARTEGGGGLGTDFDLAGVLQPVQAFGGGGNRSGPIEQAACLTAKGQRVDFEVETFVTHALRGEGFDASEDGTGRGTPIVPIHVHPTLNAGGNSTGGPRQPGMSADTADGLIPIAFNSREDPCVTGDLAGSLSSSSPQAQAVAFTQNQRDELRQMDIAGALAAEPGMKQQTYIADQWAVRRLMPLECERLQGLDDGFTAIPYRRRKIAADEAEQSAIGGARVWQEGDQWFTDCMADGPRYKMIGNSMARPVIRWILQRVVSTPEQQEAVG